MATPPLFPHEEMMTGRLRFRRQSFTGKPVLQVEVVVSMVRYPHRPPERVRNVWRDASMQEAWSMEVIER